jgi:hypothetical protein
MSPVGIGYDSHRFGADRPLILGGVELEHETGLEGHSDADVLTHAVIDALLGAGGLGDIGTLFPDDEDRWRSTCSGPSSGWSAGGSSTSTRPSSARRRAWRRTGRRWSVSSPR